MKKILFVTMVLVTVFSACKKEEKKVAAPIPATIEKFFTINNGTVVNSGFPAASASPAQAPVISGNGIILEGGSNILTITTPGNAINVIVGVKNYSGYFKIPVASSKGTVSVSLLFPSSLPVDKFEILVACLDANNNVSSPANIPVSVLTAGTGKLQVSCSWNRLNDVDLHLVQPNDEEIYYSNKISAVGGILDVDSNPACNIDSINNENITYADTAKILNGEYIVRVDFYSNCSVVDKTNFSVTARYNGQLITPTSGQNAYSGFFMPDSADGGSSGSGREIMKFKINASPAKGTQKLITFNFPKTNTHKGK